MLLWGLLQTIGYDMLHLFVVYSVSYTVTGNDTRNITHPIAWTCNNE